MFALVLHYGLCDIFIVLSKRAVRKIQLKPEINTPAAASVEYDHDWIPLSLKYGYEGIFIIIIERFSWPQSFKQRPRIDLHQIDVWTKDVKCRA